MNPDVFSTEDLGLFNELLRRVAAEMQPQTEHEAFLVSLMAQARCKLARLHRLENELLDQLLAGEPVESKVALIHRCAAAAERSYYKAHRDILAGRKATAPCPDPAAELAPPTPPRQLAAPPAPRLAAEPAPPRPRFRPLSRLPRPSGSPLRSPVQRPRLNSRRYTEVSGRTV